MALVWTHASITGNENGVGWCTATTGVDASDAINCGGYACIPDTGTGSETDGSSAQGLIPLVATLRVHDSVHARWDFKLGFAVPAGATAEAHVWVTNA